MNNKLVTAIRKPFLFIRKNGNGINRFLPIFLFSYFILIFFPYVVADFAILNNFFMGSISKLIYRAFTTGYFCVYGLLLGYVNHNKIKWPFVICGLILLSCYVVSIILTPKYYVYSIIDITRRIELVTFYIGNYSYITYGFSFLADIVSFIIFISFIAPAAKNIKQLYPVLIFLVTFMIFACIYSVAREYKSILAIIRGESEYTTRVKSLFHSKNAFGLFLFIGSLSSSFLLATINSRIRWIFAPPMVIFAIMSISAMCKSAFLCCIVLIFLLMWFFIFTSKGVTFYIHIVFVALVVLFNILVMLVSSIPALQNSYLSSFRDLIFKVFNGIFTRTNRWEMINYVVYGPFIFIGMNESNATFYLEIMSKVVQGTDISDFHSAYVSWYAHHGIIGCVIYAALIGYIIFRICKLFKNQRKYVFLLLALLLSCFIFMIPESYTLFISISAYSFIINIISFMAVNAILNNDEIQENK